MKLSGPAARLFGVTGRTRRLGPPDVKFQRMPNRPCGPRDLPWMRAALSRRRVRENALGVLCKDGSRRWIDCDCRPVPGGALAVFADVTERIVYERQTRAQMRYETAVASCAGQMLCASGFCGNCRAMRHLLDITRLEMRDIHRVALFENRLEAGRGAVAQWAGFEGPRGPGKKEALAWKGAFDRWRQELKQNHAVQVTIRRAPPAVAAFLRAWNVRSALVLPLFAGGAWLGFVLYGSRREDLGWIDRDVHHLKTTARIAGSMLGRKRLQEQMLQTQKMEAIGSLASGMAHDFNNSLSGIHATLQLLLLDRHQDGKLVEDLRAMQGEVVRASDLARRVLTFSRPSQGLPTVVDVKETLHLLERHIRRTLPKHIATRLVLAPEPLPVRMDAVQFEQAIVNLVLNARDAMPKRGTLTLSASRIRWDARHPPPMPGARYGSFVRVTVSDQGIGMPADMLPRIFDPFYTSKGPGHGTGLGLAMVRTIVDRHQGYIAVQSRPGRGSVFSLYFPLVASGGGETNADRENLSPPRGRDEVLLVVDDEPVTLRSVTALLRHFGYRVVTASDGQKALARYQARDDIRLALLDVAMPRMSGAECAERILKTHPEARIIMMSGLGAASPEWSQLREKTFAMVEKPFDVGHLLRLIRQALDATPLLTPIPSQDSKSRLPA